ncbi:hypothetical protein MMC19_004847 [Ptychographa xylographoides]|nr:hypothetical protein [Ptychographa xylographoides]
MTATTALTAQDTKGVYGIHYVPSEFVKQQMDLCFDDIGVDVVKTGMLASASTIRKVAEALEAHGRPLSVVDPVMVSTSGSQLLPLAAVKVLCEHLLPLTTVLTPNIPEAQLLLKVSTEKDFSEPQSLDDLIDMAKQVQTLGSKWVLLKGGHLPLTKAHVVSKDTDEMAVIVDILYDGTRISLIESEYIETQSTHGTGCSLASAIACGLALSHDVPTAVKIACQYVEKGIRTAVLIGKGNGPINHFHTMPVLPLRSVLGLED